MDFPLGSPKETPGVGLEMQNQQEDRPRRHKPVVAALIFPAWGSDGVLRLMPIGVLCLLKTPGPLSCSGGSCPDSCGETQGDLKLEMPPGSIPPAQGLRRCGQAGFSV